MKSRSVPLETLLYDLIYNTEEDKRAAYIRTAVRGLREACKVNVDAPTRRFRGTAELAVRSLDRILGGEPALPGKPARSDTIVFSTPHERERSTAHERKEIVTAKIKEESKKREDDVEEDFLQSSLHQISSLEEAAPQEGSSITRLVKKWNSQADSWMRLPPIKSTNPDNVVAFVKAAGALYSNLTASTTGHMGHPSSASSDTTRVQRFEKWWEQIVRGLEGENYLVTPEKFGVAENPSGHIIYTCCPRLNTIKYELIVPGVKYKGEEISQAVTLANLPSDKDFPEDHPNRALPPHWRGVFGEMDHLLQHLEIQRGVFCAIEGVNKSLIQPFEQCRTRIVDEFRRRVEVMKASLLNSETSSYRLATDYWRLEECFWAVFHEDNRPLGCSYLDRLRNRLQMWRSVIRRILKIQIRDFAAGIDSLASINQFLGNIIIKNYRDVGPGMVVRELRPAIMVRADNTTRLLKGRVIAT